MKANGRREAKPKREAEPNEGELRRALAILNQPDADEGAIDGALETLVPLSSAPEPGQDFSRRVMLAVHQAPLPEGRVPLSAWSLVAGSPAQHPRWGAVAALGAAAAAVASGAVAIFGPSAMPMLVTIAALVIRAGLSMVTSIRVGFQIWNVTATAGTALGEAIATPGVAIVLAATTVVGMLSLSALLQLLSTKQEPSRWHNNVSLFM